jgi:ABC-type oligopeptide transport system ATPase subunit
VTKKGINQIVLHALDLDISEARLQSADKLHSEDADEYTHSFSSGQRTRTTTHARLAR